MSIRIVIIDEHGPAREILTRRLDSMPGLDVVSATSDAQQGLKDIQSLQPDVVLIDTKMKHSVGMDVCRKACASAGGGKVAVLTSYLDPDERRMAYQAGVDGYLLKDVDTSTLAEWIRQAVGLNPDTVEA